MSLPGSGIWNPFSFCNQGAAQRDAAHPPISVSANLSTSWRRWCVFMKIPLQHRCGGGGACRGNGQIRHRPAAGRWTMDASGSSAWSKSPRRRMPLPIWPSSGVISCPRYLRHPEEHPARQEWRSATHRCAASPGGKRKGSRLPIPWPAVRLRQCCRLRRSHQLLFQSSGVGAVT